MYFRTCRSALVPVLTMALTVMMICPAPLNAASGAFKEQLYAALDLQDSDPGQSLQRLSDLAAEGHPRAIERLAYFTLKGIGTPADIGQAITLYQRAVTLGHDRALVSLAKAQMSQGAHEAALRNLTQAVSKDVRGAEVNLLIAHAAKRLGPLSNPHTAWPELLTMANTGDYTAAMGALYAATKTKRKLLDDQQIVRLLTTHADDGNGKAAGALIRHYRLTHVAPAKHVMDRVALLDHSDLSATTRTEEALHLAFVQRPSTFWTGSEKILRAAPSDAYARGLSVTASLNRNAYVRVVQKELTALGYQPGRANGYLHTPTLRALGQFCRDQGIGPLCRQGPLKSAAIKAVAAQLAQARQ
ncbi:MAG: SEL1-like repeat protein [Thalassovita sp.]